MAKAKNPVEKQDVVQTIIPANKLKTAKNGIISPLEVKFSQAANVRVKQEFIKDRYNFVQGQLVAQTPFGEDLRKLVESFKERGQIQEIILDQDGNCVAGFRRTCAAIALGWKDIRYSQVTLDKDEALRVSLAENDDRAGLTASERVEACKRAKAAFGSGAAAAKAMGMDEGSFSRWLNMEESVSKELIERADDGVVKQTALEEVARLASKKPFKVSKSDSDEEKARKQHERDVLMNKILTKHAAKGKSAIREAVEAEVAKMEGGTGGSGLPEEVKKPKRIKWALGPQEAEDLRTADAEVQSFHDWCEENGVRGPDRKELLRVAFCHLIGGLLGTEEDGKFVPQAPMMEPENYEDDDAPVIARSITDNEYFQLVDVKTAEQTVEAEVEVEAPTTDADDEDEEVELEDDGEVEVEE